MVCISCPVPPDVPCDGTYCHLAGSSPVWDASIAGRAVRIASRPPRLSAAPPPRDWLGLVRTCPHRGSVLPMGQQDTSGCCGGGAEVTACAAGKGRIAGRAALADCIACVAARPPVTFRAASASWTGYGRIVHALGRAIEDHHGIPVNYIETHRDEQFGAVDPWVAARCVGDADAPGWAVQTHEPYTGEPPGGVRKVSFSMCESDRISPAAAAIFNRAEVVIVPCAANLIAFVQSGVNAPVRVVPMGLPDPGAFRPKGSVPAGPATFLMAGRLEHGISRKNFPAGIEAFRRAFPLGSEAARLAIRTAGTLPVDTLGDPRIAVDRRGLTSAELGEWYRSGDAYLCPSRGEGWGLHPMEAMACGTPMIGALWGGTAAFADAATCYPVDHAMVPAGDDPRLNAGQWCDPSIDGMADAMRRVYGDRDGAFAVGRRASRAAHALTWERSAGRFLDVLREFGFIEAYPAPSATARPVL